ncbi:MAG: NAD(P)-binding domain-containing protein [Rhodospirillales bacterium]
MSQAKTVAIIGAGPVGLAAAAHALERGLTPVVLEAGPQIGHAVRQWAHVQLFSPWEYNVDQAAGRLLGETGWNSPPPNRYPTGGELLERYLEPLANRTALASHVRTSSTVTGIARVGVDKLKTKDRANTPFEIRYRNGQGDRVVTADAIIDASGTWSTPSPAGANGLAATGETDAADRIAYGMPDVRGKDRARYAGKTVAVLGAGHSAIGTLLDLVQLKEQAPRTDVIWLLRGNNPEKAFGGGANDKLAARGQVGAAFAAMFATQRITTEMNFHVTHIARAGAGLRIGSAAGRNVSVDELVVATGFRPEVDFLRELRIALDPALECPTALAPLIDPNLHSCGTVRPHGARELAQSEPGFYFAGMKSYGRAPTFLMITGYEQVRSIMADIAGDRQAADTVQLALPETGVCSGAPQAAASQTCGKSVAAVVGGCGVSASAGQLGKIGCA